MGGIGWQRRRYLVPVPWSLGCCAHLKGTVWCSVVVSRLEFPRGTGCKDCAEQVARGEWAVRGKDAAPLWGHIPLGQRTQEIREK